MNISNKCPLIHIKSLNSYFFEVTCFTFEKLLPKLSELLFMRKWYTVLQGLELVEIGDEPLQSLQCAFVYESMLSADVFQKTKVINERPWHRNDGWNQNRIFSKCAMLIFCMIPLTPPTFVLHFFLRIMFHLVSATSVALPLFFFSHRLRAKSKWRILSVQTSTLQKAFNSTNWTPRQRSYQAKLLSHVKDQWGGRKMQTPLRSVYANRREKRVERNRVMEQNREEIVLWCKQRKPKLWRLSFKPDQVQ